MAATQSYVVERIKMIFYTKIMNDLMLRFISELRFIISELSYKRSSLGISYGIGMSIADI